MKYLIYAIGTIRDILSYNEHITLNGDILDRVEEELSFLEEVESIKYTKKQFTKFHLELIELGVVLLPTTKKSINKYGE